MDEAISGASVLDIYFPLSSLCVEPNRWERVWFRARLRKWKKLRLDMAKSKETSRIKAQIDENLKRVYQEVVEEEVPEKFKELIEQLRKKVTDK